MLSGSAVGHRKRIATPSPRRGRQRRSGALSKLLPLVTTIAVLGVWELLARGGRLPAEVPPPSDVFTWLGEQVGTSAFWSSLWFTMSHWAVGLLVSVVAGVAVGVVLGAVPILQRLLQPTLEILRPIPSVIYLPVVILVWGATSRTAIFLVATAAFWPMLFQTFYGVAAIEPMLRDTGRLFGLSRMERITTITLPSVLPYIATGVRISSSLALVVAVGVELIGGIRGLGADLIAYDQNGAWEAVYGIIVLTGVLGLVLNLILERFERRLLRWHVSYRRTDA